MAKQPTNAGVNRKKRRRPKGVIPILKYSISRMSKKIMRSPLVPIIGGLILLVIVLSAVIWIFTNKNAFAVYVGTGEPRDITMENVATIRKSKNITDEWIFNNAVAKLEADLGGAKVQLDQKVVIVPVHSSKKKMSEVENAINKVYKKFSESDYKQQAAEIFVDDVAIILVKSESESAKIKEDIIAKYVRQDAVILEKDFVEKFSVALRFVPAAEIATTEKAMARLTAMIEREEDYTVQKDDSIWKVCRISGMSQDDLLAYNPQLNQGSALRGLQIGETLKLMVKKPLLSVRIVEEITYTDVEKRDVEQRPNPNMAKGTSRVVQKGADGECVVTGKLILINGIETDRIPVSSKTTVAPVLEIIEIGTK